jgi:glycosyltransferase involved in cell wall biosynthesis
MYLNFSKTFTLNISSNEKKFYYELLDYFEEIEIIAFVLDEKQSNSFHDWDISNEEKIKYRKLSFFTENDKVLKKIINYSYSFFNLIRILYKTEYLYIYVRNNNAILISNILNKFKLKYGLYVRGELKDSNLLIKKSYDKLIKNSSFNLCTGDYLLSEINKINKKSELVVPMLKFSEKDLFLKKSYEINDVCKILFIGRVEKDKGIYELLTAVTELSDEGYKIQLEVVGSGVPESHFTFNRDIVNFKGLVTDKERIIDLYKSGDIFILPSHHEGFARVLYEAMTFGIPIITTDINGTKITMKDLENCLKFKVTDIKNLKEMIIKVYDNQYLREKITKEGNLFMKKLYQKNKNNSHAKQVVSKFLNS